MTLIIGLDVAKQCGWAVFNTERSLSSIQAGVLKAEGEKIERRAASLARQFGWLLTQTGRPDLVVIEQPIRTKPSGGEDEEGGGGITATISSNQLIGSIAGICGYKALRFVTITPQSWRVKVFGSGFKPTVKMVKVKIRGRDEHKLVPRYDWKGAMREVCAREHIPVTNNDMADAVGLVIAGRTTPEFKEIQYEQSRRAAA